MTSNAEEPLLGGRGDTRARSIRHTVRRRGFCKVSSPPHPHSSSVHIFSASWLWISRHHPLTVSSYPPPRPQRPLPTLRATPSTMPSRKPAFRAQVNRKTVVSSSSSSSPSLSSLRKLCRWRWPCSWPVSLHRRLRRRLQSPAHRRHLRRVRQPRQRAVHHQRRRLRVGRIRRVTPGDGAPSSPRFTCRRPHRDSRHQVDPATRVPKCQSWMRRQTVSRMHTVSRIRRKGGRR